VISRSAVHPGPQPRLLFGGALPWLRRSPSAGLGASTRYRRPAANKARSEAAKQQPRTADGRMSGGASTEAPPVKRRTRKSAERTAAKAGVSRASIERARREIPGPGAGDSQAVEGFVRRAVRREIDGEKEG
jgi:hypothetical protein